MERNEPFIGVGHNPEGPDLPLGLGMQLAQEPAATTAFGNMTPDQKASVVRFIQSCTTGDDAKARIETAVERLRSCSHSPNRASCGIFSAISASPSA